MKQSMSLYSSRFISSRLFSIKIIHLPILLFPLFIFFRNKSVLLKSDFRYLIVLLPIFVVIMKNLLGTGCLIYPVEISCIEFLPWSDPNALKKFSFVTEIFNKSWYSYTGDVNEKNYIQNFNLISTWFFRIQNEIIEIFLTLILIFIFSSFLFNFKSKKNYFVNINFRDFKILILLIIVSSSLIFFLKNPVIRMNHFIFISLMILSISLFSNFNFKKYKINFIGIVLIIGIIFNLYKNINRISENGFNNNPYEMISNKITQQQKKKLDSFNYYIGWYGNAPVSNQNLKERNYKKIFIFDVIY